MFFNPFDNFQQVSSFFIVGFNNIGSFKINWISTGQFHNADINLYNDPVNMRRSRQC